jgi:dipeptidyl aminopeptidase/acylaminoacyl peptidase
MADESLATPDTPASPQTPFHDLDAYIALPRLAGLAVAPDGSRLVTTVAALSPDKTKYTTSVWEMDPSGERAAKRLTRSSKGEAGVAFLPDGDLLFTSSRPDPDDSDDDEVPMLWLLPAGGGEARVVAKRPGGVGGPVVARDAGTIVVSSSTFPSAETAEDDEAKRKERKENKVSAILHERFPVRRWDRDLGPDQPRLLVGSLGADGAVDLRDVTPDAGHALDEATYDISADGSTIVTEWHADHLDDIHTTLAVIDVATGERRTLAEAEDAEFGAPTISPDGMQVAAIRMELTTATESPDMNLVIISLADGTVRDLAADWDRWPSRPRWTPDGSALIVTADDNGRGRVFRIDVATGKVLALSADDSAFSDAVVSPDGEIVYALRTSYVAAPEPVRLGSTVAGQQSVELRGPVAVPELPGQLTEVSTTTADGVTVRAWLALPHGASAESPAPLLLWVHGGPMTSWNAWQWRWNPWLMVAQGYAVLLPDPALSTGYGRDFIQRGWANWGVAPFDDLMAITDVTVARDDIDADRTAMMGGSFGGYMANWIAGNTDRFDAIVSHASLWALDQFAHTTDGAYYWEREMTAEVVAKHSPHLHVDSITTPMLVIHGDKDYRVPIGEGLRLWRDLVARAKADNGENPHKFLYFPDENHWILTPQHVKVWYGTVLAFLAHHVLGEDWNPPTILR